MSAAQTIPEGFSAIAPDAPAQQPQRSGGRPVEVQLGDVTVPIYPQRQGYLANRLGPTISEFVESGQDIDTDNFVLWLGDRAFDVLSVLIPALPKRMARHEYAGYTSAEAMESGDYDENLDVSPDFPQTVAAFEAIWAVNRFDVIGKLGALVDPTMLRARIRLAMTERLSTTSQSSQPPSGGSDPTSSGPTNPTSSLSGG